MPASWMTALALSAQLVAPALPTVSPRPSLHDSARISALAPVFDTTTGQQAAPQPSKRGRMVAGALIGFAIGSVVGATVGQNADVCAGKPRWVCAAMSGAVGALGGAMAARGK